MDKYGQTWTDMDNGKIKYFDADCADLRKGIKLVVICGLWERENPEFRIQKKKLNRRNVEEMNVEHLTFNVQHRMEEK